MTVEGNSTPVDAVRLRLSFGDLVKMASIVGLFAGAAVWAGNFMWASQEELDAHIDKSSANVVVISKTLMSLDEQRQRNSTSLDRILCVTAEEGRLTANDMCCPERGKCRALLKPDALQIPPLFGVPKAP